MTYEIALNKAWDKIAALASSKKYTVKYFTDIYEVRISDRMMLSISSDTPASEDIAILVLHYLTGFLKYGYNPKEEWISFKDIKGGQSYYPAYQENTIKPILEKFKEKTDDLISYLTESLEGRIVKGGDVTVELPTFSDVYIRMVLWHGDDEFAPEVTILFDRELTEIIPSEDIAVLLFNLAKRISDEL
ncbi:protein of unknown function [Methanolobus vulcani]|jgi:hypothetical protein|uniref:DUF3786 domain-containing protein n=1 Tax=Methanolobus vulcani TaxID=38026 RepID=A0A7Z7B038_9EURY|nr:DUF3786 domain-containing protein [Methanolobus vulcani]SDF36672.1 protein of unknown function [Methanolobus vulcani]